MRKKIKQNFGAIFTIAVLLLGVISITIFLTDDSATGGVTYQGGYSCTVSDYGSTYDSCVWVSLSPGETLATHIPWLMKTTTGIANHVASKASGATPQIKAWTSMVDWINGKIYDKTPKTLRNLGQYIKLKGPKKGWVVLLAGTKITGIKDSWWPGWKWVDLRYDFYWEDDSKRMHKYESTTSGFYYKPSTGEIKH